LVVKKIAASVELAATTSREEVIKMKMLKIVLVIVMAIIDIIIILSS